MNTEEKNQEPRTKNKEPRTKNQEQILVFIFLPKIFLPSNRLLVNFQRLWSALKPVCLYGEKSMPITCAVELRHFDYDEFRKLDYLVMQHAFACHNDLGNLANEQVYQSDLAARLCGAGVEVLREVPIRIDHRHWSKTLFLDFLVNAGAPYELKRQTALNRANAVQLLEYLYLLQLERGKLVNFGARSVESEFVNAAIPWGDRVRFDIDRSRYTGPDTWVSLVGELLQEVGLGLSLPLYREAIVELLGGEDVVQKMLPMRRGELAIGNQRFLLLDERSAFTVTGLTQGERACGEQLRRLLRFSPLECLQWVNLGRGKVQFVTVGRR